VQLTGEFAVYLTVASLLFSTEKSRCNKIVEQKDINIGQKPFSKAANKFSHVAALLLVSKLIHFSHPHPSTQHSTTHSLPPTFYYLLFTIYR
jgi:hypothetical protein